MISKTAKRAEICGLALVCKTLHQQLLVAWRLCNIEALANQESYSSAVLILYVKR
jgi:hypothetical protein